MTVQELEQRKKSYVVNWYYNEKLEGRTPTDAQIQNKYNEIPIIGFTEWYYDITSCEEYERVKPYSDYLTFVCVEAGNIGGICHTASYGVVPDVQYSKNGSAWTQWDFTDIPVVSGDIVKMKGVNPHGLGGYHNGLNTPFVMLQFNIRTGKIAAMGNVMSLIDGERDGTKVIPGDDYTILGGTATPWCFYSLFEGCTALLSAPELPATTLAENCYRYMFYNCDGLFIVPSLLPATTLADGCYSEMFYNCTSLVTAPELHATNLATWCYGYMFYNCTSLVTAPELPATNLATWCYGYMFYNCTNLSNVTCLATSGIDYSNCLSWLYGVSLTGTFTKAASAVWQPGPSGIPAGWTVKTA